MADDEPMLVTGAADHLGAVGRSLTGLLLERGIRVRAMVRREDERRQRCRRSSHSAGVFLTMSTSQMQVHEAGLQQPTVLVEFDSYDIARSAHESEAYQKALQALGSGAQRDFRIVEGV